MYGGYGLGWVLDKPIMIPFGIPEETLKAEIVETKKDYLVGKITGFVKSSPDRIEPPCLYFPECGGCDYQHMTYRSQITVKEKIVKDLLKRVGKIEQPFINSMISSPDPFNYRTRVEVKVVKKRQKNDVFLGFYKKNSHNIVPIEKCIVCHPKINEVIETINYFCGNEVIKYADKIKISFCSSSSKLIIRLTGTKFPRNIAERLSDDLKKYVKGIEGIIIDEPKKVLLSGKDCFIEKINDIKYRANSSSFFQVNYLLREVLLKVINKLCSPKKSDSFLDLYSGVGTFTIPLAEKSSKVVSIEENKDAASDAIYNVKNNKLKNITILNGDVSKLLSNIFNEQKDFKINAALINPPRSGCTNEVKKQIVKSNVRKIIYLSCDPSTLARDVNFFINHKFSITEIQPIDLFPQTYHIETAVRMERT